MEESNSYQPPSSGQVQTPAPQPGSGLDFGRCLGFFFKDPDWAKKILIGTVFTLLTVVFIGTIFIAGYMIRLIRRAARGEQYPLPEWDDLGGIFMDGLYVVVAYLGYLLPIFILSIPFVVVVGVSSAEEGGPSTVLALVAIVWMVVFALVLFAILIVLPAGIIRLALNKDIRSAFEFQEIFGFIQRNSGNYLLAILIFILANFISQFGLLLLCIGIFPASFWATAVGAYSFGEVAWRDRAGTAVTKP